MNNSMGVLIDSETEEYGEYAEQAVQALSQLVGTFVDWWPPTGVLNPAISFRLDTTPVRLEVLFARQASLQHVDALSQMAGQQREAILIAGAVSAALRQTMKELDLSYLDAAGNCFIHLKRPPGTLFLLVEGRKAVTVPTVSQGLFTKNGLRLLFTLLTQPDALNATVRELAKRTGVSVGSVQNLLDSYGQAGYVVLNENRQKTLANRQALYQQWANRYEHTLKPSLLIGRYQLPDELKAADWRNMQLRVGSYWGGEAAAAVLTTSLTPATLTLYTSENPADLKPQYGLIPDPQGVVEVNRLFWVPDSESVETPVPIVPPLLVYADLLSKPDVRTVRVAQALHEQYLRRS